MLGSGRHLGYLFHVYDGSFIVTPRRRRSSTNPPCLSASQWARLCARHSPPHPSNWSCPHSCQCWSPCLCPRPALLLLLPPSSLCVCDAAHSRVASACARLGLSTYCLMPASQSALSKPALLHFCCLPAGSPVCLSSCCLYNAVTNNGATHNSFLQCTAVRRAGTVG